MILKMHFFSFKFILSLLILLNIEIFSHGAEKPGKSHHHVFYVDSVMQKPNCSTGLGSHKMRLSHRYGPCSPFPKSLKVPSSDEILRNNAARVRWLTSRILNSNTTMDESRGELSPSGPSLDDDSAEYVTTIGIGTPTVNYVVMIDTGSNPTWLRCQPCYKGCMSKSRLYDPSKSSTSINGSEQFSMEYLDNSYTKGTWSYDTFKYDQVVINKFKFGCGQQNTGREDDFGHAAGVLGLGPGDNSLVSQSPLKIGKIFGYCLAKENNRVGYLVFGNEARKILSSSPLKFTQLRLSDSSHYSLELLGISVAGKRLDISSEVFTSGRTIIDSGTVVTHLPRTAYSLLSSVFKQSMSAYEPAKQPVDQILDTCYIIEKGQNLIRFPSVTFHFAGGADVDLDQSGIGSYYKEKSAWCLAFTANKNDGDLTIIGNTQQRGMEVLYDIEGERIGFGRKDCGHN